MGTPAIMKKRDKYSDKPEQVINNNFCRNLGENNHVNLEVFGTETQNKALMIVKEKDPLTKAALFFVWKVIENR